MGGGGKKCCVLIALSVFALVGTTERALGQATIQRMQGTVEVRALGTSEWTSAGEAQALPAGSLVRTEVGSAVLSLPDGTAVALWPQTTLDLRQMEFDSTTRALRLMAVVWSGRLQFNLTVSPNPESFYVVKTPNAQITLVRTEGNIWYAKETGTRVHIGQGQATVSGAGKGVLLRAGQWTVVPPNSAPQAPQPTASATPSLPPSSVSPPSPQPPPTVRPGSPTLSEAEKRKKLMKDKLMGITTVLPSEILSPERLNLQIEQLEKRVSQHPEDIIAHARLAALYTQRKRPATRDDPKSDIDKAVILYEIVARAEEGKAESHLHLGEAYARSGEVDKAVEELQEAIRLDPRLADAHEWLAFIYRAQERFDEALREYRKAIELMPNNPLFHFNYAGFLADRGRVKEAVDKIQEAIRLSEGTPFAMLATEFRKGLAMLYVNTNQIDEAIALLRSLTQEVPQVAELHAYLGLALVRKGQIEEAIEAFQKAARAAPENPFINYGLAKMYEHQGDRAKAADELEMFLNKVGPAFLAPPGFPSLADIRDHMRMLRGQEPLQKDRGRAKEAA